MSADKFDKDIESLYSQRKQNIKAPSITFKAQAPEKKYRVNKMFSIVALGGVASFGILAVMNHLSLLPIAQQPNTHEPMVIVSTIDVEKYNDTNDVLNLTPPEVQPTIKKSLEAQPTRNFDIDTSIKLKPNTIHKTQVNSEHVEVISLLPNSFGHNIIKPTLKVMPVLERNTQLNQSGTIKLSYKIAENGKTQQINIVSSNVSKAVEKSAKKALAQWRYAPHSNMSDVLQVEFQFNQ